MQAWIGQYREQKSDLATGNIYVGGKYFPIQLDHFITKLQSKGADSVDRNCVTDVIGGCDVAGCI